MHSPTITVPSSNGAVIFGTVALEATTKTTKISIFEKNTMPRKHVSLCALICMFLLFQSNDFSCSIDCFTVLPTSTSTSMSRRRTVTTTITPHHSMFILYSTTTSTSKSDSNNNSNNFNDNYNNDTTTNEIVDRNSMYDKNDNSTSGTSTGSSSTSSTIDNNTNIDWLDYFDPRVSPHSYPKGITKDTATTSSSSSSSSTAYLYSLTSTTSSSLSEQEQEQTQEIVENKLNNDNNVLDDSKLNVIDDSDDPLLSVRGKKNLLVAATQNTTTNNHFGIGTKALRSLLDIDDENNIDSTFTITNGKDDNDDDEEDELFDPLSFTISQKRMNNKQKQNEENEQKQNQQQQEFPIEEMFIGSQLFDQFHLSIVEQLSNDDTKSVDTSTTTTTTTTETNTVPTTTETTTTGETTIADINRNNIDMNDEEQTKIDLFDYFDPLISPHSYPNGVSSSSSSIPKQQQLQNYQQSTIESLSQNVNNNNDETLLDGTTNINDENDIVDYFDPLESPHSYPNGIQQGLKRSKNHDSNKEKTDYMNQQLQQQQQQQLETEQQQLLKRMTKKPFGIRLYTDSILNNDSLSSSKNNNDNNDVNGNDAISTSTDYPVIIDENVNDRTIEDDVDLFDYFDPLVSPHSYPNGIVPSKTRPSSVKDTSNQQKSTTNGKGNQQNNSNNVGNNKPKTKSFGLRLDSIPVSSSTATTTTSEHEKSTIPTVLSDTSSVVSSSTPTLTKTSTINQSRQQDNVAKLDETTTTATPVRRSTPKRQVTTSSSSSTSGSNPMGFNFRTSASVLTRDDLLKQKEEQQQRQQPKEDEIKNQQHPLISNNENSKVKTIGILLIDHGSRNKESNHRLQVLAKLYNKWVVQSSTNDTRQQQQQDNVQFVVRGAHMELAKPSIEDGIKSLLRANVDEIICHPYFLSPNGRHVSTDIPNIIHTCMNEIEKRNSSINNSTSLLPPIRISEPVGANINLMMSAIDEQVRKVSDVYMPPQQ